MAITFEQFQQIIIDSTKHVVDVAGSTNGSIFLEAIKPNGETEALMLGLDGSVLVDRPKFYEQILPSTLKKVLGKNKLKYLGWTSEAWIRQENTETGKISERKEIILHFFFSKQKSVIVSSEMQDMGKKVNKDGELVRNIQLSDYMTHEGQLDGRLYNSVRKFF